MRRQSLQKQIGCEEYGMHTDCQAEANETGKVITCPACASDCVPRNKPEENNNANQ